MTRYIFVTGGVVSSLGKGLTTAAIGLLLESRGLKINIQKLDPYLNVDPGTMSPFQHGEVYVTDDGAETDLDLGHYERFTQAPMSRESNYTAGRIYNTIIKKERQGEFLGSTVQVVPHVTNEIKGAVKRLGVDVDVVISEIGGTVGDIESLPFLEAIRQLGLEVGKENVLFIHLTLLPYIRAAGELKTKPTQHSVGRLREIGIQPDVLICRTEVAMAAEQKNKIAMFCNVPLEAVIEEQDVETSIYEVPLVLERQGLDDLLARRLDLPRRRQPDLSAWERIVDRLRNPKHHVEIAVVGKYIELDDAYKSIYESLTHAGIENECEVHFRKIGTRDIEREGAELIRGVDGLLVPGGFGERGLKGKLEATRMARETGLPFFGICLGMQVATIEFARNVLGLPEANSTEFDEQTPDPVICLLEQQKSVMQKGGTMRLGAYPCRLNAGSNSAAAYGKAQVSERHRHRYEFNSDYRERFEAAGLRVAGEHPDQELVEVVEVADHPWFVGVQFHPEFQSRPTAAHPLFREFIAAAVRRQQAASAPTRVVESPPEPPAEPDPVPVSELADEA